MLIASEWTEERVEQLKQSWADGLTCAQIAAAMGGISRNAVIGKVSRLGLPGRTKISRNARYRSGPISYTEKLRRATERATLTEARKAEKRERELDGRLAPLVIIETPKQVEFLALTFWELQHNHCRYPRGEGEEIRFCGQPRMKVSSYCQYCHGICYGPRLPQPRSTEETHSTHVLPAGKPSSSGLTGGQSAA